MVYSQATAQRDMMEKRVTDELFNRLPQSVASIPPSSSSPLAFYNSYHGETADQLRQHHNRTPVTQVWESRRYTSPGLHPPPPTGRTTSTYASTQYPQMSLSPPPYHSAPVSTPTPIPPHLPPTHTPTSVSARPSLNHVESQEWTEYASASAGVLQNEESAAIPSPSSQGSHEKPDISEFDPIRS